MRPAQQLRPAVYRVLPEVVVVALPVGWALRQVVAVAVGLSLRAVAGLAGSLVAAIARRASPPAATKLAAAVLGWRRWAAAGRVG
jgi:hypothetical protein